MKVRFIPALAVLLSALSCAAPEARENSVSIIPRPASLVTGSGSFKVAGKSFVVDPAFDEASYAGVERFAARLSEVSGKKSSVREGTSGKGLVFTKDATLGQEQYALRISPEGVKVAAGGFHGLLYSLATLSQLLPEAFFSDSPSGKVSWTLPCVEIVDSPRFGYRGMHLDVSRHFFDVSEVKRYINLLALHKMNRLHWHLTDDQGWRVEIKKYPLLTEVGAWRSGTVVKKDWGSDDGIRYGGFYTQEEIREVVDYASSLGITVIPEIDLPGHMLGALAAYPQLGCTGGPYEVWKRWGISEQVLCPGKEDMFTFVEDVLDEIMDLFPSEYIHIGGDECPKDEWARCPACQKRIRELGIKGDAHLSAEQYLQNYVTARVQDYVSSRGRKIIGWDEILEGELKPGATVMSWRGVSGGIEAARRGFDAIMSPSSFFYLDYYQSKERDKEPFGIGGYLPLEKCYSYEPYDGVPEDAQSHILGVQANIWTEYITTPEHLEYMALPRMDALAEVQWCAVGSKDYDDFLGRLEHLGRIYDAAGYTWCKYVFGTAGLPGSEQPVRSKEELDKIEIGW